MGTGLGALRESSTDRRRMELCMCQSGIITGGLQRKLTLLWSLEADVELLPAVRLAIELAFISGC